MITFRRPSRTPSHAVAAAHPRRAAGPRLRYLPKYLSAQLPSYRDGERALIGYVANFPHAKETLLGAIDGAPEAWVEDHEEQVLPIGSLSFGPATGESIRAFNLLSEVVGELPV